MIFCLMKILMEEEALYLQVNKKIISFNNFYNNKKDINKIHLKMKFRIIINKLYKIMKNNCKVKLIYKIYL